jgi:hypothetical protein
VISDLSLSLVRRAPLFRLVQNAVNSYRPADFPPRRTATKAIVRKERFRSRLRALQNIHTPSCDDWARPATFGLDAPLPQTERGSAQLPVSANQEQALFGHGTVWEARCAPFAAERKPEMLDWRQGLLDYCSESFPSEAAGKGVEPPAVPQIPVFGGKVIVFSPFRVHSLRLAGSRIISASDLPASPVVLHLILSFFLTCSAEDSTNGLAWHTCVWWTKSLASS